MRDFNRQLYYFFITLLFLFIFIVSLCWVDYLYNHRFTSDELADVYLSLAKIYCKYNFLFETLSQSHNVNFVVTIFKGEYSWIYIQLTIIEMLESIYVPLPISTHFFFIEPRGYIGTILYATGLLSLKVSVEHFIINQFNLINWFIMTATPIILEGTLLGESLKAYYSDLNTSISIEDFFCNIGKYVFPNSHILYLIPYSFWKSKLFMINPLINYFYKIPVTCTKYGIIFLKLNFLKYQLANSLFMPPIVYPDMFGVSLFVEPPPLIFYGLNGDIKWALTKFVAYYSHYTIDELLVIFANNSSGASGWLHMESLNDSIAPNVMKVWPAGFASHGTVAPPVRV